MKQALTIACKLQPSPEQIVKLNDLLEAFADGCNYANEQVKPGITSKTTIQSAVYQDLRSKFGLSANQAVRVCARVGANRKAAKVKGELVQKFRPTSADYDARIFDFREKDRTASLTLLGTRERIPLVLANYQSGKLEGRKPTSAQLCKHQDGVFYLHIQLTDEAPDPIKPTKVIGVDLGRTDIAVTSEGDSWSGSEIKNVRDKFSRVRASLQKKASKGTRSTRRRARNILKRLSGRERRFQTWLNHNISKSIINTAKNQGASVALEDLTGIRERTNQQPRSKTERRRSNSWAFYQLRGFIAYKGIKYGVETMLVNPAYTSQTCAKCLHIHPIKGESYRSGKRFKCGHCGNHCDADENGSKVISLVGGSVSILGGSVLSCNLADHIRATTRPLALCVGESPRASAGG